MPSLRSCSVGPPPSAIHGRGRLTRHPCRVAHCAEPPLGLPTGQIKIKSCRRANARPVEWWEARAVHGSIVGAWLACDGGLTANQSLSDVHHPCGSWLACDDDLTANQSLFDVHHPCGSWLACDGGLTADQSLSDVHDPCGSWLASDGGLTVNQSPGDASCPNVGASLLAKLLILPLLLLRLLTLILICCPFPRGRTQALRRGHRGKDAAVAAPGHGWPMAAGPRSNAGVRACRA